jgi:hypothetical protein
MVKRALFYTLVLLGILALFMGCATTNADGSPKWTTKVPSNWRTYYATGYGKLSNVQNSRMRAEALATDAVARWASVTVQASLTNYFEDTTALENQDLDRMESISRQIVDISLRGIEVEKVWVAPDQGVWVLVSFPIKNLKVAYKEQSERMAQRGEIAKAELLIEYLEKELAKEGM